MTVLALTLGTLATEVGAAGPSSLLKFGPSGRAEFGSPQRGSRDAVPVKSLFSKEEAYRDTWLTQNVRALSKAVWSTTGEFQQPASDAATRFKRAQVAATEGRFAEAAREYSGVSKDAAAPADVRATAHYNVAVMHELRRDVPAAETAYRSFLTAHPNHRRRFDVTLALGLLTAQRGDLVVGADLLASLVDMTSAVGDDPQRRRTAAQSMLDAAILYNVVGNRAAAHKLMTRYVASYATNDDAAYVAMRAAQLAGPEGNAGARARARAYLKIARDNKTFGIALRTEALMHAGRAQENAKQPKKAARTLRRAVAMYERVQEQGDPLGGAESWSLAGRMRDHQARAAAEAQLLLAGLQLTKVRGLRARLTGTKWSQDTRAFKRFQSAVAECRKAHEQVLSMRNANASMSAIAGRIACALELATLIEFPPERNLVEEVRRAMTLNHRNEWISDGSQALTNLATQIAPDRYPRPLGPTSRRDLEGQWQPHIIRHCWRINAAGDRFDACAAVN